MGLPSKHNFKVLSLVQSNHTKLLEYGKSSYTTIPADPAKGVLYVTQNNPEFISGHVRMRGRNNGSYPYKYLEMINALFGKEDNTIEVCSGRTKKHGDQCFAVDINPSTNPDLVDDAQVLSSVSNNTFNRWRCDPPYSVDTAMKMYGTSLPSSIQLLRAGARVCNNGSLMFLLLGPQNYQLHPKGVKRIGCILITIIPNNEIRCLNLFYKLR
jgi:hypothetical protein